MGVIIVLHPVVSPLIAGLLLLQLVTLYMFGTLSTQTLTLLRPLLAIYIPLIHLCLPPPPLLSQHL